MKARGHTCFHSGRKTSMALVSASESAVTGTGLAGSNGSFGADCIRMGGTMEKSIHPRNKFQQVLSFSIVDTRTATTKTHTMRDMIQRTLVDFSADFGCWRPCAADCSRCVEMRRCARSRVSGSPVSGTVPMKAWAFAFAFAFALTPGAGGDSADAAGSIGDDCVADVCAATLPCGGCCAFGC
jgi:hypothetical protein